MKIYTKTGDDGTTGLIGGERAPKCDLRIECIGRVDELNAAVGLACVVAGAELAAMLRETQNDLFVIGSHLAVGAGKRVPSHLPPVSEEIVSRLEKQIDAADEALPKLTHFILPGGTETAARLHVARAICRNAERCVVEFSEENEIPALIVIYLNRLSDWLFVQARWANHAAGVADVPWSADAPRERGR
jgi:cob(I)alamin adenosyltransferase